MARAGSDADCAHFDSSHDVRRECVMRIAESSCSRVVPAPMSVRIHAQVFSSISTSAALSSNSASRRDSRTRLAARLGVEGTDANERARRVRESSRRRNDP